MMPKKKDFQPKDMKDLEEMFYGKSGDGKDIDWDRFRRYDSFLHGEAYSPTFEATAKQIFSPLGKVEKIPEEKQKKTFDFRIDQSKILLEITSLSVTLTVQPTTVNEKWLLSKLHAAVTHVDEKDASGLPDFFKGGLIFYETVFNLMTQFHLKLDKKLPRLTGILKNDLDFIVFAPQPASIDNKDSSEVFPTVVYVKAGPLVEKLKVAFKDKKYIIFVVN